MTYSTAFKNINVKTIEATKLLPKAGIWKNDVSPIQKIQACENWIKAVSEIYEVEVPEFRFDTSEVMYQTTGGGHYEPWANRITLFMKFSMVTLLHEFRHHLQHTKRVTMYKNDNEEDARAWSVSLYKLACPKSYQNAVNKGIMHFN